MELPRSEAQFERAIVTEARGGQRAIGQFVKGPAFPLGQGVDELLRLFANALGTEAIGDRQQELRG